MNKDSRVVLVTGTSSGFGKAIAEALAYDAHHVYATTRQTTGRPVAGVTHLCLDVTNESSVSAGIDEVLRGAGHIDVLVNNAGIGIAGAIEDTTVEEAYAQFDTNLFGMHRMCRAVLPHMRKQGGGHIINMSSLAGQISIPFQGFYSASKFAIEGYSEALRMEVRSFGVRVSMIEPGDFATAFTVNRRMTAGHADDSPYYRLCESAIERMARDEQANTDLTPVIDAVRAIIAAEQPGLRYPRANFIQRAFASLRPYLPQAVSESLIRSTYGLP